jgi:hypothetical protein
MTCKAEAEMGSCTSSFPPPPPPPPSCLLSSLFTATSIPPQVGELSSLKIFFPFIPLSYQISSISHPPFILHTLDATSTGKHPRQLASSFGVGKTLIPA